MLLSRRVWGLCSVMCCGVVGWGCGEDESIAPVEVAPEVTVRLLPEAGDEDPVINTWEDDDDAEMEDEVIPTVETEDDPTGPLSCNEIFVCFGECDDDDQACVDDCYERGGEASRNAVSAIGACVRDNDCRDNACVEANCLAEVQACEADDGTSTSPSTPAGAPEPGPADGALTCNEIFNCFGTCESGDSDCFDGCYARGDTRAQQGVTGISECIRDNECQDQVCVEQNCAAEIQFCDSGDAGPQAPQNPQDPAPVGQDLSCNEIFACFNDCVEGDRACTDRCYNRGTPTGQQGVSGIGACIEGNGCQDQACIEANCRNEIAACDADDGGAAGPRPGENGLTCNQVYECFDGCAGNRVCVDQCFTQGSPSGQQAVQQISQCISANACQDEACARFHCSDQIAFCDAQDAPGVANPPENAPGNALACVDIFQCSQNCVAGDQACSRACYDRGTAQGQDEADAVAMCVQNNQCRDDACARALCGAEILACETPDVAAGPDVPDDVGEEPEDPGLFANDPLAGDGTCQDPNPLRFGQSRGTTVDAPEALEGVCAGGGAERVFSFSVDQATPVCLDTDGSDFDTVLYVRANECGDENAEVVCNDDQLGIQSQVSLMANPGVVYFVVVDGYNVSGDFVLNMSEGGCL